MYIKKRLIFFPLFFLLVFAECAQTDSLNHWASYSNDKKELILDSLINSKLAINQDLLQLETLLLEITKAYLTGVESSRINDKIEYTLFKEYFTLGSNLCGYFAQLRAYCQENKFKLYKDDYINNYYTLSKLTQVTNCGNLELDYSQLPIVNIKSIQDEFIINLILKNEGALFDLHGLEVSDSKFLELCSDSNSFLIFFIEKLTNDELFRFYLVSTFQPRPFSIRFSILSEFRQRLI